MTAEIMLLKIILDGHLAKARRSERGASAVELVIITVVLLGLAVAVGAAIKSAVDGKTKEIKID